MYNKENKFSWSYSRHALFQFCERAYYFNYYGSWNGWDTYAPDHTRLLYHLKNLTSKELWFANSIRKSFTHTLNISKELNAQSFYLEFKNHIYRSLKYNLSSLLREEWKNDPKCLCINEVYYQKISIRELEHWIKSELLNKLDAIQKSKIIDEILNIPYSAFINSREILSFDFFGFPVWCSPFLTWMNKGKVHFLNFKFINEYNNLSATTDYYRRISWAMLMGLNCLFAKQHWALGYNRIICKTLFVDNSNSYTVYGHRSPKEIENIILDSSRLMKSKLTCDEKAYTENFPETDTKEKCQNCSFFQVCTSKVI